MATKPLDPALSAAKDLCSSGAPQALVESYATIIRGHYHPLLECARDALRSTAAMHFSTPNGQEVRQTVELLERAMKGPTA